MSHPKALEACRLTGICDLFMKVEAQSADKGAAINPDKDRND
jgi:hypothetical protein